MKKSIKLLFVLLTVMLLIGCGNKEKYEKIDWDEIYLKDKIPVIDDAVGKIDINRKDMANVEIIEITQKQFEEYVENCRKKGFTIDLEHERLDSVYGAFNKEGYSLRTIYSDNDQTLDITVEIPETDTMEEIEWPTTGLGAMLPKPKSTLGNISWDNSETFIVHVGNTTIEEYKKYVKSCEKKGFTKDYSKDKKYYSAKNKDGYEISLRYLGANVIEIAIEIPEKEEETDDKKTEEKESNSSSKSDKKIRKEFKKSMDDYEEFIDEYISFMKKYADSNGNDLSIMEDYLKYLDKYTKMVESFEKWEDEDLNSAEEKYYLEVQTRVSEKLLKASL